MPVFKDIDTQFYILYTEKKNSIESTEINLHLSL